MAGDTALKEGVAVSRLPSRRPNDVEASSQLDVPHNVLGAGLEFIDNANPAHPEGGLGALRSGLDLLRWLDAG
jgi:hypothetical protein